MTTNICPPAHVAPYVRILGEDKAIDFLLHFGGGELYLKWKTDARAELIELIGAKAVDALAAAQDGLPRRVPKADAYIARVLFARGLTISQVARKVRASDVTIRRYLSPDMPKRSAPDYRSDQGDLFE